MRIALLNIGNELLSGQVVNTNASWLGEKLAEIGLEVSKTVVIPDEVDIVRETFNELTAFDHVIVTGGLGPTSDDRTKDVICEFFDDKLVEDQSVVDNIIRLFNRRGFEVTERNRLQAHVPSKAKVLMNDAGTAPGLIMTKDDTSFIFTPGVPYEMKSIFKNHLKNYFLNLQPEVKLFTLEAMFVGIGESFLADKLIDWEENLPEGLELAYLPSPGLIKMRLTGKEKPGTDLRTKAEDYFRRIKTIVPENLLNLTGLKPADHIASLLKRHKLTISTAESCTGGYVASLLSAIPGSSAYFNGAVVAYQNSVKADTLGVQMRTLEDNGAVSEHVVIEMAENVKHKMQTDIGIGISGIAGPGGGTEEKPVGTVWIAVAFNDDVVAEKFLFGNVRSRNIERSAITSLFMVSKLIEKKIYESE